MFKLLNIVFCSNFDQEWDFQMVQIGYKQFVFAAVCTSIQKKIYL